MGCQCTKDHAIEPDSAVPTPAPGSPKKGVSKTVSQGYPLALLEVDVKSDVKSDAKTDGDKTLKKPEVDVKSDVKSDAKTDGDKTLKKPKPKKKSKDSKPSRGSDKGAKAELKKQAKSLDEVEKLLQKKPVYNDRELEAHYDLDCWVAEGNFCTIIKANHKTNGAAYAIKEAPLASDAKLRKKCFQQVELISGLDHPNVMRLVEFFSTSIILHTVYEFSFGGDLLKFSLNYIDDTSSADNKVRLGAAWKVKSTAESQRAFIMRQVLRAVQYLHSVQICHRDVKPESFLFTSPATPVYLSRLNISAAQEDLKLIDFGCARKFQLRKEMTSQVGMSFTRSPQMLEGKYDHLCDMWSVGILMHTIFVGYPPFSGTSGEVDEERLLSGSLPLSDDVWPDVSDEAKDLLRHLLKDDATTRITADTAVNHDWIEMKADDDESDVFD